MTKVCRGGGDDTETGRGEKGEWGHCRLRTQKKNSKRAHTATLKSTKGGGEEPQQD